MLKAKVKLPGNLLERLVPVLLVASIGLAFVVGVLWQKVSQLEGGGVKVSGTTGNTGTGSDEAQAPQAPTLGKLPEDRAKKIPQVTDSDHVRGNRQARVFLIEYSDYQCPFCQRFHPTAQQVLEEYKDQVAWVLRDFPLEQIHPQARPAANAAECVADVAGEDAYWKFSDEIFANQQTALSDLAGTAVKVGVNRGAFQSCFDAKKFDEEVNKDYQGGLSAGVTGTPGNFIVNQKGEAWFIPGAYPYDQLKPLIEEALKS